MEDGKKRSMEAIGDERGGVDEERMCGCCRRRYVGRDWDGNDVMRARQAIAVFEVWREGRRRMSSDKPWGVRLSLAG
jgi:hypothetical protein